MFSDIYRLGRPLTIVPKMSKWLIVNSQLKFVSMLHNAQSIPPDAPREQESSIISKFNWAWFKTYFES